MWFFKSKYEKLSREEVVDAICKLETETKSIEEGLTSKQEEIDELMEKGRQEKNKEVKLFYAKKINALKTEREQSVQRALYLMYNIQLMNKLKTSIDDNQFFKTSSKIPLNKMLGDQKALAKFLNKTLGTRTKAEDVLTSADEVFKTLEESYDKNESIYGINDKDDALLSMFETEEQLNEEEEMFTTNEQKASSGEN